MESSNSKQTPSLGVYDISPPLQAPPPVATTAPPMLHHQAPPPAPPPYTGAPAPPGPMSFIGASIHTLNVFCPYP